MIFNQRDDMLSFVFSQEEQRLEGGNFLPRLLKPDSIINLENTHL